MSTVPPRGAGSASAAVAPRTTTGPTVDAVSMVSERFKDLDIPSQVWHDTRQALRLLKVKYPLGSFGGLKQDNDRRRAVALLEYKSREYQQQGGGGSYGDDRRHSAHQQLTFDRLAKVAGMKLKDFRQLHETIGNFQHQLSTRSGTTNKQVEISLENNSSPGVALNDSNLTTGATTTAPPSTATTIPSLAIQLGAFVPNSATVASRANTLYQNLIRYAQSKMKPRDRTHCLQDIKMYQVEYEAACFYLVSTSKEQQGAKQVASQRLYKSGTSEDDECFDKQLDLRTLLDVCSKQLTNKSRFEMILDYVKDLQQEMKTVVEGEDDRSSNRKTCATSINNSKNTKQGTKRARRNSKNRPGLDDDDNNEEEKSWVMEMMTTKGGTDTDGNHGRILGNTHNDDYHPETRPKYTALFLEWKRKTLARAVCRSSQHSQDKDDKEKEEGGTRIRTRTVGDHDQTYGEAQDNNYANDVISMDSIYDDGYKNHYDLKVLERLDHAASEILQSMDL